MCGIAAIICLNENNSSLLKIKDMTDIVRHRGPDDEGFAFFSGPGTTVAFYGGNDTPAECYKSNMFYTPRKFRDNSVNSNTFAALGHRRLSIIDLSSAGHQPMSTIDGRYVIVYNGEIYNYLELKKELQTIGCQFVTASDTEVILYAYKYWGIDCLNKFNGMFAFIIFDRFELKIIAARDRYGVKPIYYWYSSEGFLAFASEIKQFSVLPGWRAGLNGQRSYDFLNWGISDHTNETLFAGVFQLLGGEYIESGISEIKQKILIKRWYQFKPQTLDVNFEKSADYFRDLLTDAVRLRLRSDVPIGYSLSGGLDSSSIVCIANMISRKNNGTAAQKTFSAGTDIDRFDESEFADEVVKNTGVEMHYVYPTSEDLFNTLESIIWHQDEPFKSTSIYAESNVYKSMAQNSIKTSLNGHGADELLAGYHDFLYVHCAKLLLNLRWYKLWLELKATKRLYGYNTLHAAKYISNILLPEFLRQPLRRITGKHSSKPSWLDTCLLGYNPVDPNTVLGSKTVNLNRLCFIQLTRTMLPVQLHWADRSSMAYSVEARQPFLDYRIVDFLLSLPEEYKLSKGITKKVLRQSMMGILPEKVRLRTDKMGFVTPEEIWVREHSPEKFHAMVLHAIDRSQGILKPDVISMAEQIISGESFFSSLIWRMITFGKWLELFRVKIN